jgi:hypothetical protein
MRGVGGLGGAVCKLTMVVGWRSSLGFVRRKGSLVVETYAVLGWVGDG